ncbi:MAG: ABC transporter ATP-binding protein [Desulfobacula sp.]|jgi:branched-chain amino acid transport system ATP-binding protein|uniref:ABC transporter ATP-binding protein n=1 Tax=Desulfobacula sp. TaxID=2593537 RepID=UPI001D8EA925|nr:ABC transporter ATP-binding protein [Desulfobacula sp.]MBT3486169.1 ABC transporter ATP-binding protein [Desulfobacula sp.]MBT3805643.1 ABC transporter ATP-binding protein [Desulfobacula sp.]MBT4024863.1 ABC transporter ATP-binding protein [Desulfobacula sp.]MBT4198753.1 ABC transporter ATP-binding protein [Desulfobacula sp.]
MESSFFLVDHLSISFGGIKALQNISFTMNKGEIFSVIGPNGAGKTTLFNCISGLYKPDQGNIQFKGNSIENKKPDTIARMGIARTFQNIELFSHMNTMENIMLGRHIHMKTGVFKGMFLWGKSSFAGKEEIVHRERVEEIIDFLELQNVRDKFVGALPYGTQKLIELGRALALEPDLLLLDEPCAGMNSEEKQDMIFWIKDIQDELGISILLIEHDMKMVMDISSRVLAINFGKQVTLGSPEEVQQNKEVLKAYIGEEN